MVMHGTRGNLGNLGNHGIHGIYVNLGKERRKGKGHSILQEEKEEEKKFHFPEEKEKFEMLFLNFEKRNRVLEMDS